MSELDHPLDYVPDPTPARNPKTLVIGGTGRLGRLLGPELRKRGAVVTALGRSHLDITNPHACMSACRGFDLIINCAAVMTMESEENPAKSAAVNAVGVGNIVAALTPEQRLVQISTDYVFHCNRVPANEPDLPEPLSVYGMTKQLGERAAFKHQNVLVVRAPFRYGPPWPYDNAFVNQWTSGRWIGEVAPDIALAALEYTAGRLVHIGGERRRIYDLAISVSPGVEPSFRSACAALLPIDTALDSSLWRNWLDQRDEERLLCNCR